MRHAVARFLRVAHIGDHLGARCRRGSSSRTAASASCARRAACLAKLLAGLGKFGLAGIAVQRSPGTVEHDLQAVSQGQRRFVDTAHGGDAERARQNRHMAGRPAGGGAKAEQFAAIKGRRIGRRQFFGNQDRPFGHHDRRLTDASQQCQNTPSDIADIVAAFAQQGIAGALERFQAAGVLHRRRHAGHSPHSCPG